MIDFSTRTPDINTSRSRKFTRYQYPSLASCSVRFLPLFLVLFVLQPFTVWHVPEYPSTSRYGRHIIIDRSTLWLRIFEARVHQKFFNIVIVEKIQWQMVQLPLIRTIMLNGPFTFNLETRPREPDCYHENHFKWMTIPICAVRESRLLCPTVVRIRSSFMMLLTLAMSPVSSAVLASLYHRHAASSVAMFLADLVDMIKGHDQSIESSSGS